MQIQLRQTETESGIKQDIVKQGIKLAGKTIDASVIADCKEAGMSADILTERTPTSR